jgi:hypothetical protein
LGALAMVQVELSKHTFARLQKHAVPLVDSIETVVARVLDFYERGMATSARTLAADYKLKYSLSNVPDLKHTKIISAQLDGVELENVNWNSLLIQAVWKAGITSKKPDELKRLIIANFVIGQKEDEGYRFFPRVGISIQGQDANSAAKAAFHIAHQRGWKLNIEFLWRDKEGAARPGKMAFLSNDTEFVESL